MNEEQPAAAPPPAEEQEERHAPEAWAAKKGTRPWDLAGARHFNHWVVGDLLTEAEYDAGCKNAGEEPLR